MGRKVMNESIRRILNCLVCALSVVEVARADIAGKPLTLPRLELSLACRENEYELAKCFSELITREEARLDELRAKVHSALPDDRQHKSFEDLEEAWKKYVEASCGFEHAGAAGNSASALFGYCKLTQTQLHLQALTKYLRAITVGGCDNDVRLFLIEYGFQCADR
jgi:hypothetical protein